MRDLPYLKEGFETLKKNGARFGIESMHGMRDVGCRMRGAKMRHAECGILDDRIEERSLYGNP